MTVSSRDRAAVFLDKDGTLIDDVPFNVDPSHMRLTKGANVALPRIDAAGFRLVVVSNQSGVARGLFPIEALEAVHQRLDELFALYDVELAGFYFCPHLPGAEHPVFGRECDCRKPAPGLLLRGAADLGIDLSRSWMVGDILDDVEAGNRAGCRTVLVGASHETEWHWTPARRPWGIVPDLASAADLIVATQNMPVMEYDR